LLLLVAYCTKPVAAAHDDHGSIAPTLPLSDINVIIVTDVHSWVGGHILPPLDGPEPRRTADYGDVLSFVEHLKNYVYYSSSHSSSSDGAATAAATPEERDVWLVMNGDWIDGTGLAMNGDGTHLIPILEKMNFDAVTVGNHELYSNNVIAQMLQPAGLIEFLGHRYVSSNVMRSERTDRSIGNLYTLLRGRHANLLVFGFLYEMTDAGNLVTVKQVSAVVQAPWFQAVVKATTEYHAILVLAHMDVNDPLLQIILTAIRVRVMLLASNEYHVANAAMPRNFICVPSRGKTF
jgi:2',3'-cyclic-nucleotide 2'-phosphodiesterase (5'-nucleotidase family)